MPSPGDSTNLGPNLRTLAQLGNKPGSKLSYDKDRGRFSIQEAGVLQTLARTFSSDSVTSEEYFGAPIRELFAAAHSEIGGTIQRHDVTQAVNGLKALRHSYTGEREKLAILDAVIEDAELGVKKDPAGVIRLRERHQQYLKFGFAQVMFLPDSNPGVRYSFTVHWARRILLGRTHFGMSKGGGELEAPPLTLDAVQKARIMKKVERTIRPLQAELKDWAPSSFGTVVMHVGKEEERFEIYGNLLVAPYAAEEQQIGATARGSEVMKAVLDIANPQRARVSIFLVNLRKDKKGGHTIGIHLEGALHFFDPNLGEFAFPNGSEEHLKRFLDEWWEAFYMDRGPRGPVQHFRSWGLEGVSIKNH